MASGEVLRIDPVTGARERLAALDPGLDNCVFVGERLFVSDFTGRITEVLGDGRHRAALAGGFNGPFGLAVGNDGDLYIADGPQFYALAPGGAMRTAGMLFTPGCPGYIRGVATADGNGFVVATSSGGIALYRPAEQASEMLAEGLDQPYGVAVGPDGTVVAAELGTGRVLAIRGGGTEPLASGLADPTGIAITSGGECLVAESAAGRVSRIANGRAETLVDGLDCPQGLVVRGKTLYIVDAGAKAVIEYALGDGRRRTIAAGLPVGPPAGVVPKPLRGLPPLSGPMGPFAGIAAGADVTLFVSCDGDGSVIALRPPAISGV